MKFHAWMTAVLLIGVMTLSIGAAAQTAGSQTVTGCLQKGLESQGFFVIAANGQHWELYAQSYLSLAELVGQKVTMTGTVAKRSAEQEEKSQPYEKKEISGREHADLQVFSVKVVAESCK
jgi:hypothetical protein